MRTSFSALAAASQKRRRAAARPRPAQRRRERGEFARERAGAGHARSARTARAPPASLGSAPSAFTAASSAANGIAALDRGVERRRREREPHAHDRSLAVGDAFSLRSTRGHAIGQRLRTRCARPRRGRVSARARRAPRRVASARARASRAAASGLVAAAAENADGLGQRLDCAFERGDAVGERGIGCAGRGSQPRLRAWRGGRSARRARAHRAGRQRTRGKLAQLQLEPGEPRVERAHAGVAVDEQAPRSRRTPSNEHRRRTGSHAEPWRRDRRGAAARRRSGGRVGGRCARRKDVAGRLVRGAEVVAIGAAALGSPYPGGMRRDRDAASARWLCVGGRTFGALAALAIFGRGEVDGRRRAGGACLRRGFRPAGPSLMSVSPWSIRPADSATPVSGAAWPGPSHDSRRAIQAVADEIDQGRLVGARRDPMARRRRRRAAPRPARDRQ